MIKEKLLEKQSDEIDLSVLEKRLDVLSIYLAKYFDVHKNPKIQERYYYLDNLFSKRNEEGENILSLLKIPQYENNPEYKELIMLAIITQPKMNDIFIEDEIKEVLMLWIF
jgi:hypothetical protein